MLAAPVGAVEMPVPVWGARGVGPGVRTPATVSTGVGVAGGRVAVAGTVVGGTAVGGAAVGGTAVGSVTVVGTGVGGMKTQLLHVVGSSRTFKNARVVVPPGVMATPVWLVVPAGENGGVRPGFEFEFSLTT